jgi:predicted O-methyltransferase YrrM
VNAPNILHRPELGWRRRHVFAALGLRHAIAQHSEAEGQLLQRYAEGGSTIVEIGVLEGGSALELRVVMDPAGTLVLIDPYEPGRFGVSMARIAAARTIRRSNRGTVRWIRTTSSEAAAHWNGAIDFLFIDGDHSLAAVRQDWDLWAPMVRTGGHVALHDARVVPGGNGGDRAWIDDQAGPVILAREIGADPRWCRVGAAETTVVFRRLG